MADFGTDPVSCNDIFNKEVMLKTNKQEPQLPSYSHQEIKGSQEGQVYPSSRNQVFASISNFLAILFRIAMQKVLAVKYLISTSFFFQGECFLHSLQSKCSNQNRDESWNHGLDYWRCSLPNWVIV